MGTPPVQIFYSENPKALRLLEKQTNTVYFLIPCILIDKYLII